MFAGSVLIILGILIAMFPQLLSIIVALLLVVSGTIVFLSAHQYRRTNSMRQTNIIRFIFRN